MVDDWNVKELGKELVLFNERTGERYYVPRRQVLNDVPNVCTVYQAFVDHATGSALVSEAIRKTYYAPLRGRYESVNDGFLCWPYRITKDEIIVDDVAGVRDDEVSMIEDLIAFPGSLLPGKVRNFFRKHNIYLTGTSAVHLKRRFDHSVAALEPENGYVVYFSDNVGVMIQMVEGKLKPGEGYIRVYDVREKKIMKFRPDDGKSVSELYDLMDYYVSLVYSWNDFVRVMGNIAMFGRKFTDGTVIVKVKDYQPDQVTFEILPPISAMRVSTSVFSMDFEEAVYALKRVSSVEEFVNLVSFF